MTVLPFESLATCGPKMFVRHTMNSFIEDFGLKWLRIEPGPTAFKGYTLLTEQLVPRPLYVIACLNKFHVVATYDIML